MRLIDADALFAEFENVGWYNNADRDEVAERLILQAPTIDAVEVVRCKDCRWYDKGENEVDAWSICTRQMGIRDSVIDTDYCSFADRRQESEVEK